jgi:hypothetical protein
MMLEQELDTMEVALVLKVEIMNHKHQVDLHIFQDILDK